MEDELKMELKRQSVHFTGLGMIPIIYIFGSELASFLIASGALVLFGYSIYVRRKNEHTRFKKLRKVNDKVQKILDSMDRNDPFPYRGALYMLISGAAVALLFSPAIASAAIAVLCVGDSFSTIVGKLKGKHILPVSSHKTWEGTITFFTMSLLACLVFLDPVMAFIAALSGAFIEASVPLNDNLTVPIFVGIFLAMASLI